MANIIPLLATILPIIALLSVVFVVCLNLYLKIRRKFLVRVNCWFCNQWTKVPYDEQNCFECPTCLQYNGFNSDGDYNKPIPAQHDEMLNQPVPKNVSKNALSNGLCHLCNNNQQLRIYQLAHFIPLNEANYDVEIEHFQKQLDKAYKLCSRCEKVVKKTIRKQNCLLGLKFSQLRKKGVQLLDLNNSYNGISKTAKWMYLKNLMNVVLTGFAVLNLMYVVTKLDYSDGNLKKVTPNWMLIYVLSMKNMYLTVSGNIQNIAVNSVDTSGVCYWFTNKFIQLPWAPEILSYIHSSWDGVTKITESYLLPKLPQLTVDNATLLCVVSGLLQFMLLWSDTNNHKRKLLQLCAWCILVYFNWNYPYTKQFDYVNAIQVAASVIIVSSMCIKKVSRKAELKKSQHVFEKLKKPKSSRLDASLGDISDNEENDFTSSVHNSTFRVNNKASALSDTTVQSACYNFKPVTEPFGILENCLDKTQRPFCDTSSTITAGDSLNQSFTSARSFISDRTSRATTANNFIDALFKNNSPNKQNLDKDLDIDISLNKLHLGNPLAKKTGSISAGNAFYTTNIDTARPKPVVSPAKLKNVTQNSWVAGGFWRDSNGILMPINSCSNLSRSSSQTSGFVSQAGHCELNHFNSLPSSINNSFCGDFECNSVLSEPLFDFNGTNVQGKNVNPCCARLLYHNDVRRVRSYHPVINHEQLVYLSPNYSYNGVYNMCLNKSFLNNSVSPNNSFSQDVQKN